MAEDTPMTKARSLWGEAWVRLRRKPLAMVCLGVVCMYLAVGLMDAARFRPSEGDPTAYLGMRDGKVSLVDVAFTILLGERDKEDTYAKPGVGGHVLGADIQGENVLLLERGAARIVMASDWEPEVNPAVWWPDMGHEIPTQRIMVALPPGVSVATTSFQIVSPGGESG